MCRYTLYSRDRRPQQNEPGYRRFANGMLKKIPDLQGNEYHHSYRDIRPIRIGRKEIKYLSQT